MNGLKTTGAREALMVMILGLLPACSADDADASGDAGASNGGGGDSNAGGSGRAFVYDDVVEGCVRLVGCGLPGSTRPNPLRIGLPGLQNSMDMLADDGIGNDGTRACGKVIDCARDHAGCEGFLACLLYPYTDQACEDQGPRCDGDVLVDCIQAGGTHAMVTECAQLGMTCDGDGAAPVCRSGVKCTPGSGAPCTPEGNVATCFPVPGDPTQGRERGVDCVSQHAVCDPEDFRCTPTATDCVAGETDTCLDEASGFTGCAPGEVVTVPCARLGRTPCTFNGGHAGCQ